MPEAAMSLQYEGPAVDAGTMDVRTLAPALIAVADAMREAHVHLRIPGPLPQVHVRATRPGSFIVDLLVADADTLAQRTIAILNSPLATADSSLVALVGTVIGSVNVVKRIRNRRINQVQAVGAAIVITLEDGTRIEAPSAEISLVSDADYRRALQGMVKPLAADEGVNRLILSAGNQAATVTDDDLPAFDVPPAREEEVLREPPQVDLEETEATVVLRIISVAFTEGAKWRFNDGDTTFYASIEDPDFIAGVNRGTERFAKGDMLRVRLRSRQTRDGRRLRVERVITRVIQHIPRAVQLQLSAQDAEPQGDGGD